MLTGIGLLHVNVAMWGVAIFVLCIGSILYGHYGEKELELEKRVRDVEALNVELRHQIAERSRELAQKLTPSTQSGMPKLGSIVAGRYEVLRELGSGGMGRVFEVARVVDGAHFALKVMHGQTSSDAVRFAREAEIAAKLAHPNLVAVADVGIGSWGTPFIVMELVSGGTLADRALEPQQIGAVLAAVARGVAALHARGVVHRDLKPSNVLIAEKDGVFDVKLADFGVARAAVSAYDATVRQSQDVTKAGAFIGTPLYMAPEQAKGSENVKPSADVFSFGVMAYELFAGKPPFPTPLVFLALADAAMPETPTFEGIVADAKVREVLRECLAVDPERRPSAEKLAGVIEDAFRGA
jgi:serine/threonine protein kinase